MVGWSLAWRIDRPKPKRSDRKKNRQSIFFYFASRPYISGTSGPTKIVHLSKFAGFHKANSFDVFNFVCPKENFSYFIKKQKIHFTFKVWPVQSLDSRLRDCITMYFASWYCKLYYYYWTLYPWLGFFFCRPTSSKFQECEKKFGQPIFFYFLFTDRLHTNVSPQIRYSIDQPTMALPSDRQAGKWLFNLNGRYRFCPIASLIISYL